MSLIEKIWIKCPNCGRYQMTLFDNNVLRCNEHKCQYADSTDGFLFSYALIDVDDAFSFLNEHGLNYGKNQENMNHPLVFKSSLLNILRDAYFAETILFSSDIKLMATSYTSAVTHTITHEMFKNISVMNIYEVSDEEWIRFSIFTEEMTKDWSYAGFKKWMKTLVY